MSEINLSNFVPYNLIIDETTNKITHAAIENPDYSTRKLFDMSDVIHDQLWLKKQDNFDLYYMYRDLTREQDKELFKKHKIRFDVTIIPPAKLGKEFVKTAGHFHPIAKKGFSYPEIYEVMHGKALYLLQKQTKKKKEILELIIIPAKAGDQVIIPPNYGHITVNPTANKTLVMNNLVSSEFSSIYKDIKKMNGAAYLYYENGSWIRNATYSNKLLVKEKIPKNIVDKPLYLSFLENPEQWEFLNEPWLKDDW